MALKLPRGHSLTTENQEIPRCLLLNNTLYYNICVFRIIKFIWYKNNTSFAHSVWPQYHDLIKLEFTLPDHASTKVTACNTYWFLRKRILKDFSSYILMQKMDRHSGPIRTSFWFNQTWMYIAWWSFNKSYSLSGLFTQDCSVHLSQFWLKSAQPFVKRSRKYTTFTDGLTYNCQTNSDKKSSLELSVKES